MPKAKEKAPEKPVLPKAPAKPKEDSELRKVVKQALFEGANPGGFSPDLKSEYEKMLAEKGVK